MLKNRIFSTTLTPLVPVDRNLIYLREIPRPILHSALWTPHSLRVKITMALWLIIVAGYLLLYAFASSIYQPYSLQLSLPGIRTTGTSSVLHQAVDIPEIAHWTKEEDLNIVNVWDQPCLCWADLPEICTLYRENFWMTRKGGIYTIREKMTYLPFHPLSYIPFTDLADEWPVEKTSSSAAYMSTGGFTSFIYLSRVRTSHYPHVGRLTDPISTRFLGL